MLQYEANAIVRFWRYVLYRKTLAQHTEYSRPHPIRTMCIVLCSIQQESNIRVSFPEERKTTTKNKRRNAFTLIPFLSPSPPPVLGPRRRRRYLPLRQYLLLIYHTRATLPTPSFALLRIYAPLPRHRKQSSGFLHPNECASLPLTAWRSLGARRTQWGVGYPKKRLSL